MLVFGVCFVLYFFKLSAGHELWRTELRSFGEDLGEVRLRRGIFQRHSLLPLLFVIMLIPLTLILRKARSYAFENGEKNKPSSVHGRS